MPDLKKILILTADAGFGHRSAANAIQTALLELHPRDCLINIVNPLQDKRVPGILRKSGMTYDRLVREMPRLYKLEYDVSDLTPSTALLQRILTPMLFEVLHDLLQQFQPDVIVSPYPLYQAPLAFLFAFTQRKIPLLTVVTDLAPVHRIWFHEAADFCLVSMPAVRDQAVSCDLNPDKVIVTGIPVNPGLALENRRPAAARAALGWSPDLTTVLAVGSARVKNLPGILNALNHSALPLQLAVVAGGDDRLYKHYQSTQWHIPTQLYNFVENMPALMHAADCIICKAGGLIVTESLACGLPILLTDVIEGQETSNAQYVVSGSAGELVRSPLEGLEVMYHWLADGAKLLSQHAQNAKRLGYPRSAYDVAEKVWAEALRGPQRDTGTSLPDRIDKIIKRIF